jgi:uncharacterized protein
MTDVTVVHDAAASRFDAVVRGEKVGFVDYRTRGNAVELLHTEVDPDHREDGVASDLVQGVLDQIRVEKLNVIPTCPFVASYLEDHEEYQDLLAPRS